jgi:hypothetical protein
MRQLMQFFAKAPGAIVTVTVALEHEGKSEGVALGLQSIFKHALTHHIGLELQHQTGPVEVQDE